MLSNFKYSNLVLDTKNINPSADSQTLNNNLFVLQCSYNNGIWYNIDIVPKVNIFFLISKYWENN